MGSIFLRLWPFFYSILSYCWVGLSAYFSSHSLFSREHIFVGFNTFLSLMCWWSVIHHHRPQGPTLFQRVRWDFTCVQCNVCTDTGPPVLSHIQEDYVIPYLRGLQQNKRRKWESNLSASTGSQVQPSATVPDKNKKHLCYCLLDNLSWSILILKHIFDWKFKLNSESYLPGFSQPWNKSLGTLSS